MPVKIAKLDRRLRSQSWFNDRDNPGMTALYLERYLNYGLTQEELTSGKPIIGIAQTGSDLSPCNLDTNMADNVLDLLSEINENGVTIIMVTHELSLADRAKRNIFVRDGQVTDAAPEFLRAANG